MQETDARVQTLLQHCATCSRHDLSTLLTGMSAYIPVNSAFARVGQHNIGNVAPVSPLSITGSDHWRSYADDTPLPPLASEVHTCSMQFTTTPAACHACHSAHEAPKAAHTPSLAAAAGGWQGPTAPFVYTLLRSVAHDVPSRSAFITLLTLTRVHELSVNARAALVLALYATGLTPHSSSRARKLSFQHSAAIVAVFCGTHGVELTHLKAAVNMSSSTLDLFQLVYHDLASVAHRMALCQHFAVQAAAVCAEHAVARPVQLLTDYDDTVQATWTDKRLPQGSVYPGVVAFFRELQKAVAPPLYMAAQQAERPRRDGNAHIAAPAVAVSAAISDDAHAVSHHAHLQSGATIASGGGIAEAAAAGVSALAAATIAETLLPESVQMYQPSVLTHVGEDEHSPSHGSTACNAVWRAQLLPGWWDEALRPYAAWCASLRYPVGTAFAGPTENASGQRALTNAAKGGDPAAAAVLSRAAATVKVDTVHEDGGHAEPEGMHPDMGLRASVGTLAKHARGTERLSANESHMLNSHERSAAAALNHIIPPNIPGSLVVLTARPAGVRAFLRKRTLEKLQWMRMGHVVALLGTLSRSTSTTAIGMAYS
ncbi:MAG: hypothetical protein EOO41_01375 [Methanobacteriota archaeon]|nr:MAG: hypothetical protein EOO41_01375 [Euryarchaeota archaeon]